MVLWTCYTAKIRLVGRESEIDVLAGFLAGGGSTTALVLAGEPGIGKTALWERGVALAREQGFRVLSTRASDVEARLSFAGLVDLFDGIELSSLEGLPPPQRRAFEVALLRADPADGPPEERAIAVGLLNALRGLARDGRVAVAIDDLQWLDTPSADALHFAARRLVDGAIRFLLARRVGVETRLEQALRAERIEIAGLSLGALRLLLGERLGLSLPRFLLRRIVDTTLGNPLFALEVGRLLEEQGAPGAADDLPVPGTVTDLLEARVARLSPAARHALLAAGLAGELRVSELARVADADALDEAVEAGLLGVDRDRVRPSHPLFAAAATKRSSARERRELHRRLAEVSAGGVRARHLALAASAPDAELAEVVARAADAAAARGARREAIELAEHALRLTPSAAAARAERLVALASDLQTAGELQQLTELLGPQIESIPSGPLRARAWLVLAEGAHIEHVRDYKRHLDQALAEAGDDPGLRARVVAKMSSAVIGVERIAEAETAALAVLPDAERAGAEVERPVLYALGWARALGGKPLDELCSRFAAASASPGYLAESPERIAGQRLVWRGELGPARRAFDRLLAQSDERGESISNAWARIHLCELALRAGDVVQAGALLDEWAAMTDSDLFATLPYQRCRALLAAVQGAPAEAEHWATETIAGTEAVGTHWDWLEALRARGTAAILGHEAERAVADLRSVWTHTEREGVDEPGVFPVAPELVEVLLELGEFDEARAVNARLERLARQQEHPWGLVTAERCGALVSLAGGYAAEHAATLERAASRYGELGLRFDEARTFLLAGRAHRRHRKWAAARNALEQAVALFEGLGATGWAEEARSELARVGARAPAAKGTLTPTEQQVAELAAAGLANKEIAATLFVTVRTVEEHLSHAYAKLGIHSRSQLAARL